MKPVTYRVFNIEELIKAFHYAKGLFEVAKFGILVTISLKKQKRSIEQNGYYWGIVINMIAEEMGHTPDEVHQILAKMFLKIKEVEIDGVVYAITKSTTKLKTDEMEEYLEKCRRYASINLHIVIPLPNETIEVVE